MIVNPKELFGLICQILVLQLKIFNYKGEWGLQQTVPLRLVQFKYSTDGISKENL